MVKNSKAAQTPILDFALRWLSCTKCPLHRHRHKVVLFRGDIPADVLFIGEAPGQSEDIIGQPFVGPAGNLLEQIISMVRTELWNADIYNLTYSLTNVVCCYPEATPEDIASGYIRPTSQIGMREPLRNEVLACRPRLTEFIELIKPKLIISVGKISKTALTGTKETSDSLIPRYPIQHIIHPSAILRMQDRGFDDFNEKQQFEVQRCVTRLATWIAKYVYGVEL